MLNQLEFEVLTKLLDSKTQHENNKGTINSLLEKGLIDNNLNVTDLGVSELEPYKVNNAIIMAAGLSSRFAPLSYEKPKSLLTIKGEILIERQIKQLKASGINDITIVVGYKKELFYYLRDKFNVSIVENNDYSRYNNTSTLIKVLDKLNNTYICSSDNYFSTNVFEPYVYRSYYSAIHSNEYTNEYCLTTDSHGLITDVNIGGGPDVWFMLGHVYFGKEFCDKFVPLLKEEYTNKESVRKELWEDFYIDNINYLSLYIKKYADNIIYEFDSLDELRCFDDKFINNTDSKIMAKISNELNCSQSEIINIKPCDSDENSLSFTFTLRDKEHLYTHFVDCEDLTKDILK